MSKYKITISGQDYSPIEEGCLEIGYDTQEECIDAFNDTEKYEAFAENNNFNKNPTELCKEILKKLNSQIIDDKCFVSCNIESLKRSLNDKNSKIELNETKSKKFQFINNEGNYFQNIVGIYHDENFLFEEDDIIFEIDLTVKIGSRMDEKPSTRMDEPSKCYFLSKMLLKAYDLKITGDLLPTTEDDLFDFILVYIFVQRVKETYKQGFYKTYFRYEKNDDRVRGSIDISRHIRLNMGMKNGKIAYSYREKTIDNDFNHFLIYVYEFICTQYSSIARDILNRDLEFRRIILQLKNMCISYSSNSEKNIINKAKNSINHPYFHIYEMVRQIGLKIISRKGMSIFGDDDSVKSFGLLYYIPDLWEYYVQSVLESIKGLEVNAQLHVEYFGVRNDENDKNSWKYTQSAYPDYVIYRKGENHPYLLLDAKFRKGWWEEIEKPLSTEENRSDFQKCIRDMILCGVHKTGVIFPIKKEENKIKYSFKHKISPQNEKDMFYTIGIDIPVTDNKDYSEWEKKLKESEREFANIIEEIVPSC